jgi:hypothetical protein
MRRFTAAITRLAIASCFGILTACGGTAAKTNAPTLVEFPGQGQAGVAAHYTAVERVVNGQMALDIVQSQEVGDYEAAFNAKSVAGATIVYPAGSKQQTDAREFDASGSAYARAHPEPVGGRDAIISFRPPAGSAAAATTQTVFAPSESQEQQIVSGVIPPGLTAKLDGDAAASQPNYIWSCSEHDYRNKSVYFAPPDDRQTLIFVVGIFDQAWYTEHFYRCGSDEDVKSTIPFSEIRWDSLGFWQKLRFNEAYMWSIDYSLSAHPFHRVAVWASPNYYVAGTVENVHVGLTEQCYSENKAVCYHGR